jgi:hypothetical protein
VLLDARREVMFTLELFVPDRPARCDQHAAAINGVRVDGLVTATEAGRLLAARIAKRPSVAMLAETRHWALAALPEEP